MIYSPVLESIIYVRPYHTGMDIQLLQDMGLSQAEARIYLALLQLGQTTTGSIIDKTKLQSSTVYHVLGSLTEKGLVSYIIKGKTKHYQAAHPDRLRSMLEDRRRHLEVALPALRELEKMGRQKQTAQVYEGVNGLRTAFYDILHTLDKGDLYYFFSAPEKKLFYRELVVFFRNYHLKRAEAGIRVHGLTTEKSKGVIQSIFEDIKHTRIKTITDFAPTGLVIYADKLITWDWDEIPTAIVIQSVPIVASYKRFFETKWRKATPLSQAQS